METQHKEEISSEDAAWANMSYGDRFLWYLDNKILKNNSKLESRAQDISVNKSANEPVSEPASESVNEPANEPVIEPVSDSVNEPLIKVASESTTETAATKSEKRSKGKKINITM